MREKEILSVLKIFWPEVCPFCGRASRRGICLRCREKLDSLVIKEPRCMCCGKPVRYVEQEYCYDCSHTHHDYDRGLALWVHKNPVSQSIYRFKFHNQRSFGAYYAKEMVSQHKTTILSWNIDFMIPIPIHPKKRRKRGYNQAEIVAGEIGKLLSIPVDENILVRVQDTDPQKTLDPQRRRRNIRTAFAVRKVKEEGLRGASVLLIDDIYTTGSTIDEAARILKKAGAEKVYYLTISIGQGY